MWQPPPHTHTQFLTLGIQHIVTMHHWKCVTHVPKVLNESIQTATVLAAPIRGWTVGWPRCISSTQQKTQGCRIKPSTAHHLAQPCYLYIIQSVLRRSTNPLVVLHSVIGALMYIPLWWNVCGYKSRKSSGGLPKSHHINIRQRTLLSNILT